MKSLRLSIMIGIVVLAMIAGNSIAAISDYILTIEPEDESGYIVMPKGGFIGKISELDEIVGADTPELTFDKVIATVNKHKNTNDTSERVAEIEAEIAALEAEKKELLSKPPEELKIYDLLIAKDAIIYRRMLRVLSEETGIEKQLGTPVYCVMFKPDTKGNPYGTKLIWAWMFGKWQE